MIGGLNPLLEDATGCGVNLNFRFLGNKQINPLWTARRFSKSRQQGAPQPREAASHVIGGDKTIGWLSRGTQVAIYK
jgi:hypothetical protein